MITLTYDEVGCRIRDSVELAVAQATQSDCHFRHGAILFQNGRIYSSGQNQKRCASWVRFNRKRDFKHYSMHAEISCMHQIKRGVLRGKSITVVRLNRKGKLRNSQPCSSCLYEMKRKEISKCYFSINEKELGLLILK